MISILNFVECWICHTCHVCLFRCHLRLTIQQGCSTIGGIDIGHSAGSSPIATIVNGLNAQKVISICWMSDVTRAIFVKCDVTYVLLLLLELFNYEMLTYRPFIRFNHWLLQLSKVLTLKMWSQFSICWMLDATRAMFVCSDVIYVLQYSRVVQL